MELAQRSTTFAAGRDEQTLVAAARRGDDRAFEQLYARYQDRVSGFIYSKVRDHGRAEDISQEVFMAALRQLRSSDQAIAFKPWIFAIAKNACIDEFRRSSRAREVPVETDDNFPTGEAGTLSLVPTPAAAIEGKQRLTDLRGAFGGLSESHHQLLVMRELEGRSYDEIGERLGMTKQMVESGLFRARRKLSEEYEELASGRRCEQVQTVIDTGDARTLHALGIKQRRRVSRHLSHCEACRHHARLAGVDETLLKPRSIGAKIAALLPFGGLWRWPWRGGRGGSAAAKAAKAAKAKTHAVSGHVVASAAGAAQVAGTAGSSFTLGQAAVAAAALAIAGAGGGVALAHHGHAVHPARPAVSPVHRSSAGSGAGSTGAAAATGTGAASAAGTTSPTASTAGHLGSGASAGGRSGTTAIRGSHATSSRNLPARSTRHESPRQTTSGGSNGTSTTSGTPAGGSPTSGTANPASGVSSPASGITSKSPVSGLPSSPVSGLSSGSPVSPTSASPVISKTLHSVTDPINKVVSTIGSAPTIKKVVGTLTGGNPTAPAPSAPVSHTSSPVSGSASSTSTTSSPLPDPISTVKKIVAGL